MTARHHDGLVLHWELADEEHVTSHGVSRAQIDDMVDLGYWVRLPNPHGGPGRSFVIGQTSYGRMLTIVVQWLDEPGHGVPITAWPSSNRERAVYWTRFR